MRPQTNTKATGANISANVADQAAAAIRRAGFPVTPGNVRMVIKAQRAVGMIPVTDFDFWDRLVRECPLAARRQRPVAQMGRDYRVRHAT